MTTKDKDCVRDIIDSLVSLEKYACLEAAAKMAQKAALTSVDPAVKAAMFTLAAEIAGLHTV